MLTEAGVSTRLVRIGVAILVGVITGYIARESMSPSMVPAQALRAAPPPVSRPTPTGSSPSAWEWSSRPLPGSHCRDSGDPATSER